MYMPRSSDSLPAGPIACWDSVVLVVILKSLCDNENFTVTTHLNDHVCNGTVVKGNCTVHVCTEAL